MCLCFSALSASRCLGEGLISLYLLRVGRPCAAPRSNDCFTYQTLLEGLQGGDICLRISRCFSAFPLDHGLRAAARRASEYEPSFALREALWVFVAPRIALPHAASPHSLRFMPRRRGPASPLPRSCCFNRSHCASSPSDALDNFHEYALPTRRGFTQGGRGCLRLRSQIQ